MAIKKSIGELEFHVISEVVFDPEGKTILGKVNSFNEANELSKTSSFKIENVSCYLSGVHEVVDKYVLGNLEGIVSGEAIVQKKAETPVVEEAKPEVLEEVRVEESKTEEPIEVLEIVHETAVEKEAEPSSPETEITHE